MDYNKLWQMIEEYGSSAKDAGYAIAVEDGKRTAVETYLAKCRDPRRQELRKMAHALREHNAWRRGDGKYGAELNEAGEVVGPGAPQPIEPKELGELLEAAADELEEAAE